MGDAATERIIDLQNRLRVRMAELGFEGIAAARIVHHLAEISVLARDLADESVPLLVELSHDHREALARVVAQIKLDLDEIRDGIQDMEPDITELLKFLRKE
jgi:hypothetical protein